MILAERSVGIDRIYPEAKLQELIREDARVILSHQNLKTGLFPAATLDRRIDSGHYGDAWIRDTSAIDKGLLYGRKFSDDEQLRGELGEAARRSIDGILDIASKSVWQRGFRQQIADEGTYTHITQEAPPIHLTTDGEVCQWPRQNQPDSWGAFLIVVGKAHEQGVFTPTPDRKEVIASIAQYLINIKAEKFESSSMWEDREVRNPPPVSTALIVHEGLKSIRGVFAERSSKRDQELMRMISRRIHSIGVFTEARFPEDFTWIEGHNSRTDLATLVAFGYGDYSPLPLTKFLARANAELGGGDLPGKIRFQGDPYYRHEGKEAVWRMAKPLEAIVLYRLALRAEKADMDKYARGFRFMADARLEAAVGDREEIGYDAELMYWQNGKLVPNGNDLLWNRSLMMDAASLAIKASKF